MGMKKGQQTKQMILGRAAALFNTEGYTKASMSDIMSATGLEKGGIYNHFGSKDQLMLESFDHAVTVCGNRIKEMVDEQPDSESKLCAIVDYFTMLAVNPPIAGGCPLMNTAIECDDSMPELRNRAKLGITRFLRFIEKIILDGMGTGELRGDLNPADLAPMLVASLEGALMLGKLYDSQAKTNAVARFWKDQIHSWKRRASK
jgi:TetR/AcrR family transcriptional regulator, transcriptional repressor for nem operon